MFRHPKYSQIGKLQGQTIAILTSTGGSRAENSKIQKINEKLDFLEKSPLQFPIVQNSSHWLKIKNRDFCAKNGIPHFYPLWGAYWLLGCGQD